MLAEKIHRDDRRRSARWQCEKTVSWRVRGGRRIRSSLVPEKSLHGLVIAASKKDAAPAGTFVVPSDDQTGKRHAFRTGVICRTVDVPDGTCWMYVDILD